MGRLLLHMKKRNGTIQGGTRQKLSAGDIVRIPLASHTNSSSTARTSSLTSLLR